MMGEKINELEEEVGKGISINNLIKAGAEFGSFSEYLVLNGKIYEPIAWEPEFKSDDGMIGIPTKKRIPTHYRERNAVNPNNGFLN